jgi:hypothetical protein
MNKIKFLIILLLIPFLSIAQSTFDFLPYEYGQFKTSGQALCGLGNAHSLVTRSDAPNQFGNYVYQIYFATNSYFPNCVISRTYIPDIHILYSENDKYFYPINYNPFWVTVGETALVYTLFHNSPKIKIKIVTGHMTPTNF